MDYGEWHHTACPWEGLGQSKGFSAKKRPRFPPALCPGGGHAALVESAIQGRGQVTQQPPFTRLHPWCISLFQNGEARQWDCYCLYTFARRLSCGEFSAFISLPFSPYHPTFWEQESCFLMCSCLWGILLETDTLSACPEYHSDWDIPPPHLTLHRVQQPVCWGSLVSKGLLLTSSLWSGSLQPHMPCPPLQRWVLPALNADICFLWVR